MAIEYATVKAKGQVVIPVDIVAGSRLTKARAWLFWKKEVVCSFSR